MSKLIHQILRFGVVGVISFLIDYVVGLIVMNIALKIMGPDYFATASVIGSVFGFVISVIANYILSFKFVFQRKEDMDRREEFIIFVVLSLVGMGINSLIIWIFTGPVYATSGWVRGFDESLVYTGAKVIATAIVMVYNFVTRKIFLESHDNR